MRATAGSTTRSASGRANSTRKPTEPGARRISRAKLVGGAWRQPRLDLEIQGPDAFQLWPVPSRLRERPTLGRQQGAVDRLQRRRRLRWQVEALTDRFLQEHLGLPVKVPELAAVLQRMREVDAVGRRRVVEQRPELVRGVPASGSDEIGGEARMLRH